MKKITVSEKQIQTLSELVARANLASSLGLSYDGSRDLYQALGYKKVLQYSDFQSLYQRLDIARAVIDRPVNMTWRGDLLIMEESDDQETSIEKQWKILSDELKIKTNLVRLDRLTCLGQFSILLLGLDDVKQPGDFIVEVNKGARKLLYIKPFGQGSVNIEKFETDSTNPRYGLPTVYSIQLTDANGNNTSLEVHHSRILHVAQNLIDSEIYGTPVMEPIYNRLKDIEKLVGGSAEMFWRGARPGLHGKIDKDFNMTPDVWDQLQNQMDEFDHNLRRILVNKGIDIETLVSQVSDPTGHVDVHIQMISAQTGIPKRILTGSERGELASSQDETAWLSFIQSRREEYAEPCIIRPFVNKLIELKILPKPKDEYFVDWQDLFSVSDEEKAKVGLIRAQAMSAYLSSPVAESILSPEAFFEYFLGLDDDQIERITEMAKKQVLEERPLTPEEEELSKKGEDPRKKEVITQMLKIMGGQGSGNFGHGGRPGFRGGSDDDGTGGEEAKGDAVSERMSGEDKEKYLEMKEKYNEFFKSLSPEEIALLQNNMQKSKMSLEELLEFDKLKTKIAGALGIQTMDKYIGTNGWQGDSSSTLQLSLKYWASQVEGEKMIYPDMMSQDSIDVFERALKDKEYGPGMRYERDEYLKLRAFNQAYMEVANIEKVNSLYRGTDGMIGTKIASTIKEQGSGNKLVFHDPALCSYTDKSDVAVEFGEKGVVIQVSKVPRSEIFAHKNLLSGLTKQFVNEGEYILMGDPREVNENTKILIP